MTHTHASFDIKLRYCHKSQKSSAAVAAAVVCLQFRRRVHIYLTQMRNGINCKQNTNTMRTCTSAKSQNGKRQKPIGRSTTYDGRAIFTVCTQLDSRQQAHTVPITAAIDSIEIKIVRT